jgi:ABC-type nitrate/sulfonate/bicarbonate transport system permease component
MSRRLGSPATSAGVWLVLLGVWWLIAATQHHAGTLWPEPNQVASTLWHLRRAFLTNVGTTLHEAAIGFVVATALAILGAVASQRIGSLTAIFQHLAVAVYALPWIASGLETKVIIAALASFFPVFINLTQALRTTDAQSLELMRVGGATPWQAFRYVELPYALPMLFAGLTLAAPAAILGAMLAEWVGANQGLGIQLLNSMQEYQTAELYACLLVASVLSLLAWLVFTLIGRRLFPWHPSLQPVGVKA